MPLSVCKEINFHQGGEWVDEGYERAARQMCVFLLLAPGVGPGVTWWPGEIALYLKSHSHWWGFRQLRRGPGE